MMDPVTVSAQQYALAGLFKKLVERKAGNLCCDSKILFRWINMMEVESSRVKNSATAAALAAKLRN
jgi:hypothetical protein